jgi:hypothetical protein
MRNLSESADPERISNVWWWGARFCVLNPDGPSGSNLPGARVRDPIMPRLVIACLIAAACVVATAFSNPSDAATHRKHVVRERVEVVRARAVPAGYYGAPPNYYGAPPNYYPAPPFPFFLLPGPWWLPGHP